MKLGPLLTQIITSNLTLAVVLFVTLAHDPTQNLKVTP